jgi:hypothetical protein
VSMCASLQIELILPRDSSRGPASRHVCKMSAKVAVNNVSHVSSNRGGSAVIEQERKEKLTTLVWHTFLVQVHGRDN